MCCQSLCQRYYHVLKVTSTQLEKDLQRVTAWIEANGLLINVLKTQLMVLVSKRKRNDADKVNVMIEDTKRDHVTYLGGKWDKNFSWKQ